MLETVAGLPLGGPAGRVVPSSRRKHAPVDALAAVIEGTLDAGSPAVAFSGGRDSSLVLAVTAAVCRRAGLEPPVPITLCLPGSIPEADERPWQERVLDHLGIRSWRRIAVGGELDLIGPYARRHLLRDGLLFPANTHSLVPMLEAAGERCLIVGLGGDELLSPHQWRSVQGLLGRRRRPDRRDVMRLSAAACPRRLRGRLRPFGSQDELQELSWLRPGARARLGRSMRRGSEEPVRWDAAIRHLAGRRDVVLPVRSMERVAAGNGHRVLAPLFDAGFVASVASAGGSAGWGSRTAIFDALAADLLPKELIRRTDKAAFNRVFFSEESRAFAAAWSGAGLDDTLIDPDAVRSEWLSEVPDFRTALLLQSAWLTEQSARPAA